MLTKRRLILLGIGCAICSLALASWQGDLIKAGIYSTGRSGTITVTPPATFSDTVTHSGAVTNSSTVLNSGAVTNASTVSTSGNVTNSANTTLAYATVTSRTTLNSVVLTNSAASLTSPTTTWAVSNDDCLITLNSDANQTGIYPTGGTLRQVLIIKSGSGSNTMRFDDATSMSLGSNITLTEAQNDVLTLMCVSSDGDEWIRLSNADN